MRLVLIGGSSFIARHVLQAAQAQQVEALSLPHDADIAPVLRGGDIAVNFAIRPSYRTGPYREDQDQDLRAARAAAAAGVRFAMLSTRRVYPDGSRWDAREDGPTGGDETFYGQNKARSEAAVTHLLGGAAAIFRLSNVFGMEYDVAGSRRSFLGLLSRSLKLENVIRFDMHPNTRRDFIPVENCASAIVTGLCADMVGPHNLGAGFPVRCGDIAGWICEGFGSGELIVDPPAIRDEFFLNMERWKSGFAAPVEPDRLRAYCADLGRRLACENS